MGFELPTVEQLISLSERLGITLSDADARHLRAYMEPVAATYEYLDSLPEPSPAIPARDHRFPEPAENAFGAWWVKASIKQTDQGPLHGKRIVVKDNIAVAGLPMQVGSAVLDGYIADYDATVVQRVLAAGGEIVGKSVCECFCMSGGSSTAVTGVVSNPRRPGFSTGGSSSGSAALLAADKVDLALGTDQGGSVRIPASWTGVCGMKATRGVVPYDGGMVMEQLIDYIGPLSKTVADNALLLDVLADRVGSETFAGRIGRDVDELKIGILDEGFGHPLGEREVDDCVLAAADVFRSLGCHVDTVSVKEHLSGTHLWSAVIGDGIWQSFKFNGVPYNHGGPYSLALHQAMQRWRATFPELPVNARLILLLGGYLERYDGYYYTKARQLIGGLKAAYDRALADCDLLLLPTTVQTAGANVDPAGAAADDEIMAQAFNNTFNTCQFNATGHPAISLPCGRRNDLPVGLMLVGQFHAEATLYQAAYAFEQSGDWTAR